MIIYRASELGGCLKAMIAKRLDYPVLDQSKVKTKAGVELQELYDEGTRLEEVVLRRLYYDYNWRCVSFQLELDIPILENVIVQGHVDAIKQGELVGGKLLPDQRVVEIKSMRPISFNNLVEKGWEAPGLVQKYKWQFSSYILGAREYFGNNRIEGVLVAIDSDPDITDDDARRIHFLPLEQPHYSLADIRARVMMAESWVRRGELPVECDFRSFPCPVFYLHEDEEIEEVSDEVLTQLAIELKEAQRDKKVAEEREKEARRVLTGLRDKQPEAARSSKKKTLDNGQEIVLESVKVKTEQGTVINWYQQMNPGRLDEEQMKKDGVDVEKYRKKDKGWRMRVDIGKEVGE